MPEAVSKRHREAPNPQERGCLVVYSFVADWSNVDGFGQTNLRREQQASR